MKKLVLILCIFSLHQGLALNIQQVTLSPISETAINVSLNTEAVELYYFHSWNYTLSGHSITLNAYYVSGFGSTIDFLNNNFEVPIGQEFIDFTLSVRIYYIDIQNVEEEPELQDELKVTFETPLNTTTFLSGQTFAKVPGCQLYPNPTSGIVFFSIGVTMVEIYSINRNSLTNVSCVGGQVDLSALEEGIYLAVIFRGKSKCFKKIVLKK